MQEISVKDTKTDFKQSTRQKDSSNVKELSILEMQVFFFQRLSTLSLIYAFLFFKALFLIIFGYFLVFLLSF